MPTRQSPINHIWYFSWYFSLPGETAVLCSKSQQSLKPHSHRHSKRVWKHDLLELDPLRFVPCYMTAYEAGFSHFIKLKFHRGEKKKKKKSPLWLHDLTNWILSHSCTSPILQKSQNLMMLDDGCPYLNYASYKMYFKKLTILLHYKIQWSFHWFLWQ